MTKFYICYNPFLIECEFRKNGLLLNKKSKFGDKSNRRLQELLDKSINWGGLAKEIDEACSDNNVEITFRGREIDYDDLRASLDKYEGDVKFTYIFKKTKSEDDIISKLDAVFKQIGDSKYSGEMISQDEINDICKKYEEAKNGIFNVSVIATMSSGKTTLINAILNKELLPAENKACTATIAEIYDNDTIDGFEVECYGNEDDDCVFSRTKATPELLREYNSNEAVRTIRIEGNIPCVSSDKIHLCLTDTPGPNNSRNENHGKLTRSIISDVNGIVLYVINVTQLFIRDDNLLLREIASEMEKRGKLARDRFIFVINKCDDYDVDKEGSIEQLLCSARDYLKDFNIEDPILIPTTARLALLIRRKLNGEALTRKETSDLVGVQDFVLSELLHFEKYATLTPTVREKLQKKVDFYHADENMWDMEALIHTGIPAVEETIAEYIEKYAYPMKIKDSVKDIIAILDEIDMISQFNKKISEDNAKRIQVKEQIQRAKEKHRQSKGLYDSYKEYVNSLSLSAFIDEDEILYQTEQALERKTRDYNDKGKIDKSYAHTLLYGFGTELTVFQREVESEISRQIDEEVFRVCNHWLEEYTIRVNEILEGIEISDFDFSKIRSFGKIKIHNMDDISRKYEYDRTEKFKTGTTWNKEKIKSVKKFFSFKEPWRVDQYEERIVGVDVDVSQVIVEVMADYLIKIRSNIKGMFRQADEQVEGYKEAFKDNMDQLSQEIENILTELDKETSNVKEIESRITKTKHQAEWASSIEKDIKGLLAMEE